MDWLEHYFEEGYLRRWSLGPPGDAELREASALVKLAGLSHAGRALDVGCGSGKYTVPLGALGWTAVGLDFSEALLMRAISNAEIVDQRVHWVRADMAAMPFTRVFDFAVMNDAFGYMGSVEDDQEVLSQIRQALLPAGRFVIRNVNAALIRSNFRAYQEEERLGTKTKIWSALEEDGRVLTQRLEIMSDGNSMQYRRRQQLYSPEELREALRAAGFEEVRMFGGWEGEPLIEDESPKVTAVAA